MTITLSPEEQEGSHRRAEVSEKRVPVRGCLSHPHRHVRGQDKLPGSCADPNQVGGDLESPGQEEMGADRAVTGSLGTTTYQCLWRQHLEEGPGAVDCGDPHDLLLARAWE